MFYTGTSLYVVWSPEATGCLRRATFNALLGSSNYAAIQKFGMILYHDAIDGFLLDVFVSTAVVSWEFSWNVFVRTAVVS